MTTTTKSRPAVDLRNPAHRVFLHLLVNVLLVSVINFTVWFAITFWVYLETRSVRDRDGSRHLSGGDRAQRDLVRQSGGPPPQEERDAGLDADLAGALPGAFVPPGHAKEIFTDPPASGCGCSSWSRWSL